MRKLLKQPEPPATAFLKGAGGVVLAMLVPMAFLVFSGRPRVSWWMDIGVAVLIIAIGAILAGSAYAGWALLQQWAYRRVTTKDDPWQDQG
jgi:hypothetical protein